MYPVVPVQPFFQHFTLTNMMYQFYGSNNEDPSINLKPMLLHQNEDKFVELIGRQILKMQKMIEDRLEKMEPIRNKAYENLLELARLTYSEVPKENIEFRIYGSMVTKLAIDTSDMDISIDGVIDAKKLSECDNPRHMTVSTMERIHERLNALEWVEVNHLISTATIPIIKLVINLEKLDKQERKHLQGSEAENTEELVIKTMKIDLNFTGVLTTNSAGGTEIEEVHS